MSNEYLKQPLPTAGRQGRFATPELQATPVRGDSAHVQRAAGISNDTSHVQPCQDLLQDVTGLTSGRHVVTPVISATLSHLGVCGGGICPRIMRGWEE